LQCSQANRLVFINNDNAQSCALYDSTPIGKSAMNKSGKVKGSQVWPANQGAEKQDQSFLLRPVKIRFWF
jgi:hypothetical protein